MISHLLHICSLFCDVRYLYFFQLIFWMMVNNCNRLWTCLKRKADISIACNQLKWLCINLHCTHRCCHKWLVFHQEICSILSYSQSIFANCGRILFNRKLWNWNFSNNKSDVIWFKLFLIKQYINNSLNFLDVCHFVKMFLNQLYKCYNVLIFICWQLSLCLICLVLFLSSQNMLFIFLWKSVFICVI